MMQLSLDRFVEPQYVPALVLRDIDVAWFDRDWHLHEQDIAHLDMELARILAQRGFARILNFSQSYIFLDGHGKALKSQRE